MSFMRSRDEILNMIRQNREAIKRFGVKRMGLFGSYGRGEARRTSDLDFVVELESKTFSAYMGLKFFLEELFQCRVDLVLSNTIKPRLRERIAQETTYAQGL
jgi:predicted nucleotidyltransferase